MDGEGSRVLHARAAEAYEGPTVLACDGVQDEQVLQAAVLHAVPRRPGPHLALRLSAGEFHPVKEPGAPDDGGEDKGEDGIFPVVYLHVPQTCHHAGCGH